MSTQSNRLTLILALAAAGALSPAAIAQGHDHDHAAPKKTQAAFTGDPYLLDTDPVSGAKLGPVEKQVILQHDGRELRFASEANAKTFKANPAKYLPAVDAALVRQQLAFYPLKTCIVSGDPLDSMGGPVDLIYRNRLVRLCCKDHETKFLADPATYIAQLDAAVIAAQKPKYPLKTCVVSGEELGGEMGEPVDVVIGNRLIRLCCKNCRKNVFKEPLSYLGKLGAAAPPEQGKPGAADGHDHEHGGHGHGRAG